MRKIPLLLLLVALVLAVTVTPGETHWRGGVFIGVGPYWAPYPYYWYPPPPYYYSPPSVVVTQPPVYIEQPPVPPAPAAAAPAYWYYCVSAKGYYPTVPACPEEWVKVPERSQ